MSHLPWRIGTAGLLKKFVHPRDQIKTWKVVKGDTVEIMTGKDKGARGRILEVQRRWNTMLIEGCRMNKKRAPGPNGEKTFLYEIESPVHYNEVQLIDPKDDKPVSAKFMYDDDGKRVRVSTRTLEPIPMPRWRRRDFDSRLEYVEGEKDTKDNELRLRTYFPSKASTFEEDVLENFEEQTVFMYPPTRMGRTKKDRKRYPRLKRDPIQDSREDVLRKQHHGRYGDFDPDNKVVPDDRDFDYSESLARISNLVEATQAKQLDDWELRHARGGADDGDDDGSKTA